MTGFTLRHTAYSLEHHNLGFSTSVFQGPNFLCCYAVRLIWEQQLRAAGIKSGNQASEIAQQVKRLSLNPTTEGPALGPTQRKEGTYWLYSDLYLYSCGTCVPYTNKMMNTECNLKSINLQSKPTSTIFLAT